MVVVVTHAAGHGACGTSPWPPPVPRSTATPSTYTDQFEMPTDTDRPRPRTKCVSSPEIDRHTIDVHRSVRDADRHGQAAPADQVRL